MVKEEDKNFPVVGDVKESSSGVPILEEPQGQVLARTQKALVSLQLPESSSPKVTGFDSWYSPQHP